MAFSADFEVNEVKTVTLLDLISNEKTTISARYFVDATELGDLLPLTETEFVTGSESRTETGEPSAKEIADPVRQSVSE